MKKEDLLIKSINQTLDDVKDLLAKAGVDFEEKEDDQMSPEGEEQAPMAHEGEDQEQDQMPPEGEDQEQAPEGEEQAPEGEEQAPEGEEGEEGGLEEHLGTLSDEELQELLMKIQSEQQKRVPEQPAEEPMAPESPMQKSMTDLSKAIADLTNQVSAMKKERKEQLDRVTKAATTSRTEILHKSSEKPQATVEKLSKSEVIEQLLNRQRNGERAINSSLINEIRYIKEDDADSLYKLLKIKGISIK